MNYEDPLQLFVPCLVFEIFWQKQCAVRHLGTIMVLIKWVFDDVTSRVKLLKLNFFETFLKMLWVNWVLKRLWKIESHIDNDMLFAR
jgi:hypothetical protein